MIHYLLNTSLRIDSDVIQYGGVDLHIINSPISSWDITPDQIIAAWNAGYDVLDNLSGSDKDFVLHVAVEHNPQQVGFCSKLINHFRQSSKPFRLFDKDLHPHCFTVKTKLKYSEDPYQGLFYSSSSGAHYSSSSSSTKVFDSLELNIPIILLQTWSREYIEKVFLVETGNRDDLDYDKMLNMRERYYNKP